MARRPHGFSGAFARVLKFWPLGETAQGAIPFITISNAFIFSEDFPIKARCIPKRSAGSLTTNYPPTLSVRISATRPPQ